MTVLWGRTYGGVGGTLVFPLPCYSSVTYLLCTVTQEAVLSLSRVGRKKPDWLQARGREVEFAATGGKNENTLWYSYLRLSSF